MAELYRQTHVVLAPSRSTARWVEQFGRMIVEAQASGCVVVGYESGSIPEVGGDAAILVPEGDVEALAAAARKVLGDPDEFEARRRSGLALARERTWSKVAAKQVELYRAALEAGPGATPGGFAARTAPAERSKSSADRPRLLVKPDRSPSPTSAVPPH